MLNWVIVVYVTLLPIIITGIVNAIFCKTSFLKCLKVPIDGGKVLKDGKRLFGENKTWKGFIGTPVICMFMYAIWGRILSSNVRLESFCSLYMYHNNKLTYNLFIGFLIGFVYAILELPNSYIKRRVDINSGKQGKGGIGILFKIYDQIDSLVGVMFVMILVSRLSFVLFPFYLMIGGITHVALNYILYKTKLRKNIL